jgi:hypothetical protein
MPTILLRIDEPPSAGKPFPTEVFTDAVAVPAGQNWLDHPFAAGEVPADGSVPGSNLTPVLARDQFATDPGAALPVAGTLGAIGDYLFRLLANGGFPRAWTLARRAAGRGGVVRTVFDVRPAVLAALPWELLREPTDRRYFFQLPGEGVTHGRIDFEAEARPSRRLLRVLIVLGSSTADQNAAFGREREALLSRFRQDHPWIDWDEMDRPDVAALNVRLTEYEPDVVHFIGHGRVAAESGESEAVLQFDEKPPAENNGSKIDAWEWGPAAIRAQIGGMRYKPRLGFISACYSGAAQDPGAWSVGRAFLEGGAEAVVTMQGQVSGGATSLLAAEFYKELVNRQPVDLALAAARNRVVAMLGAAAGFYPSDWAMPRLHLRVPAARVFRANRTASVLRRRFDQDTRSDQGQLARVSCYGRTLSHVDRRDHRRNLLGQLDELPRDDNPHPPHLFLITGPPRVGKTDLGLCTLAAAIAMGFRAVYVDLSRGGVLDAHRVLCRVRDGGREVPMMTSWPAGAFTGFSARPTLGQAPDEHAVRDHAAAFLGDLGEVARRRPRRPVLLTLDQFTDRDGRGVIGHEFASLVVRHLLAPLAGGAVPNVYLLLILTDETDALGRRQGEYTELDIATLSARPRCQLKPFEPGHFSSLATEYCLYREYLHRDRKRAARLVEALADTPVFMDPWWPSELAHHFDNAFRPRSR